MSTDYRIRIILIVEEESSAGFVLRQMLDDPADCELLSVAHSIGEGLDAVYDLLPDIVIVSATLPDMDVPDMVSAINRAAPGAAVILLASRSAQGVSLDAVEAGVSHILTMPAPSDQVLDAVRTVYEQFEAMRREAHPLPSVTDDDSTLTGGDLLVELSDSVLLDRDVPLVDVDGEVLRDDDIFLDGFDEILMDADEDLQADFDDLVMLDDADEGYPIGSARPTSPPPPAMPAPSPARPSPGAAGPAPASSWPPPASPPLNTSPVTFIGGGVQPVDAKPHFTAYYPAAVRPAQSYVLKVFAHTEAARDTVASIGQSYAPLMGGRPDSASVESLLAVEPGDLITIVPQVPGLTFQPAEQTIAWRPPLQSADFVFAVPADRQADLSGWAMIYLGPLLIGQVALRVAVTQTADEPITQTAEGEVFQKVFASYSHRDTPVMEYFRATSAQHGQQLLVDIYDLRAGEHWAERLLDMIDEAQVFQLFWSSYSAQSTYCRQEWEHALQYVDARPRFIQPVWWDAPMPSPPSELSHLHFQRVPLPSVTRLQLFWSRLKGLFS